MSDKLPVQTCENGGQFLPEIRRGRYSRLTIYEVEAAELEILERGGPDSLFLNFAVALLSAAVSLGATFFTASIESVRVLVFFYVVMSLGFVLGLFFLLLWWRSRASTRACVDTIRNRLPPEWMDEAGPDLSVNTRCDGQRV